MNVDQSVRTLRTRPRPSLFLERVAALKAAITEAVKKRFPGAELTIVADPGALDNETIVDLVRSIWMQVSNLRQ
jgi:hypothetical protein